MKINIKIPKSKIIIKANNLNEAKKEFYYNYLNKYTYSFSSEYGNHYMSFDHKTHIVYNVEVYKRGKHKENKRYEFQIYSVKESLFDFVKINQENRYFKIIAK